MNMSRIESIEDQLQKPGYLLLLVIILLLLIIGFVNMIDHTSSSPDILGKYSVGHVVLTAVYFIITLWWANKLRHPNQDAWLVNLLDRVQKRTWASLAVVAGFLVIFFDMFQRPDWLAFPAIQFVFVLLMLLTVGGLLIRGWGNPAYPQAWRRFMVGILGVILGVELVIQALTLAQVPPSLNNLTSTFTPYGRIYQTEVGGYNGAANSNGWHYPEFRLTNGSRRVVIVGDGSIQALQIQPDEHMGIQLEQLITGEEASTKFEVLAAGNPDYGPGLYLSVALLDFLVDAYEPDEIITVFDFKNDFQTATSPGPDRAYLQLDEEGYATIHPDSFYFLHFNQHRAIWPYEGVQLNRLLRSHYLTPRVLSSLFSQSVSAAPTLPNNELQMENAFVFNEATNDEAMAVALGTLRLANDHLAERGVTLTVVTQPAFPTPFFEQNSGSNWSPLIGESNLFLPEQTFQEFAAAEGIPFLAMGTYMQETVSTEQLQTLYFAQNGTLTVDGHTFFANALFDCFFAESETAVSGCYTP